MAEITIDSQRELRNAIETQFGNLLELLMDQQAPYKLCAEINEAFTRYAGNAQMLTENRKEFTTL